MISFYISILSFLLFADFIMIVIISSDNLLSKYSSNLYKIIFSALFIITLLELILAVHPSILINNYFRVGQLFRCIIKIVVPILISLVGNIYREKKTFTLTKYLIICNIILQIVTLFNDKYYILANGYFDSGNLYSIYNIIYFTCIVTMIYSIRLVRKKYQSKNRYILIFITFIFIISEVFQNKFNEIVIILTCLTLVNIFLYAYYVSIINKIDALTFLLNRRCFEVKINKLKKDTAIFFFDINEFKAVNDTYGHAFGDIVIQKICNIIIDVYGKRHGLCYRIGGDEFCVILEKSIDLVEILNTKFEQYILEEQKNDNKLPSVSVGYSYYYKNKSNIVEVIKDADEMMYRIKNKVNG